MPQRQGKRQGLRTNATVRRNEFEHNANRGDYIMDRGLPLSLSKSKRWELIDDQENQLPVEKMIHMHEESNRKGSPFRHSLFSWWHFHRFRSSATISNN